MNKMTNSHIRYILLISLTLLVLTSCGVERSTITPTSQSLTALPLSTQSLTPLPPYIHYGPSETFNIHLEFDYPGSWVVSQAVRDTGSMIVVLYDPRFFTLPTLSPEDSHPTPNDFGSVRIRIIPISLDQPFNTLVESHKQAYSHLLYVTELSNYEIKIQGYDAIVFEDQIQVPEIHSSLMFERNIFFTVKDQMYQIIFSVAEKERGGEFEKGYEYFFKSLKIVP